VQYRIWPVKALANSSARVLLYNRQELLHVEAGGLIEIPIWRMLPHLHACAHMYFCNCNDAVAVGNTEVGC
jgi:hypothetical protein